MTEYHSDNISLTNSEPTEHEATEHEPTDSWTEHEPTDSWGIEEIGVTIVESVWTPDYFTKIRKILECPTFDKSLTINTFVNIYDIEEQLVKHLVNSVIYYCDTFNIIVNKETITFGSLCLANCPIDEHYVHYLKHYLDTINLKKKDIELICLNVIDSNNLEMFKIIEGKFDISLLCNVVSNNNYNKLEYNIINHAFKNSSKITHYILDNYNFNIYGCLINHLDIDFNNFDSFLQNKFINKLKESNINSQNSCDIIILIDQFINSNYYNFIENLVFKLNKIELYDSYIRSCIDNHKYTLLRRLIYNRTLILPQLNYDDILISLIDLFDYKIKYSYGSKKDNILNILNYWNLLFPYIEKYNNNLEEYFSNNDIHSIVGFRHSLTIIKDIQPYIIDWNKQDRSYFIPLLDCIRYSSYNSVKYMIEHLDVDLYYNTVEYNILTCAMYNSDPRVIKYIGHLIKTNTILNYTFKIGQQSINDYITTFRNINDSIFNKLKIKLNIIIDILGHQIIDDIFNTFIYNKNVVKHLITNYNYKPTFNRLVITHAANSNRDYLKLVIDNTDFSSTQFKYNNFIIYITRFSIYSIEVMIELFDYAFKYYNIKKTPIENSYLEALIFNVYDPYNHTNELFETYIRYLRKHIIINDTLNFYEIIKYDSNISNFNNIVDILFKNGFYFLEKYNLIYLPSNTSNKLNNLYNYQLLFHINTKKKMKCPLISNWCIVIYTLKLFVRKRFKKIKQDFTYKLKDVNHEFKFKPSLVNTFNILNTFTPNKPYHIMPIDCLKPLNETHIQITQKADGICKTGCFNIYPIEPTQLELSYIEYEFVKSENICYFFNYLDKSVDIYDIILSLREIHPFIPTKIYPYLTLSNYKEVLIEYDHHELEALTKFKTHHKFKKKWWAKYIFKFEPMSHTDYMELLQGIKQLEINCIPTDGWILIDNDYNDLIKIKPDNHLTIDLVCTNNTLLDNQGNMYKFKFNLDEKPLLNGKIYRCYFDDSNQCWDPREIRNDKHRPNDVTICRNISLSHHYKWTMNDLTNINLYYQKNTFFRPQSSKSIIKYTNFINGNTILDLGCGFKPSSSPSTNYVGLDVDPKVSVKQSNKYMCDLTLDWDEHEQLNTYKNSFYHFPNIMDFKAKYHSTKFDTILSINSIHYLLEGDHSILFNNINRHSHNNSLFIVKCLDGFLTKSLLIKKKYVTHGSSFVRREAKNKIKIYYDWCHNTPQIETLYDKEVLMEIFNKYGWKLQEYKYELFNPELTDWEQYFRCFSVYVFSRF